MPKEVLNISDFSQGSILNGVARDIPTGASPESIGVAFWRDGMLCLGWMLREYTEIKTDTVTEGDTIPLGQEIHLAWTFFFPNPSAIINAPNAIAPSETF